MQKKVRGSKSLVWVWVCLLHHYHYWSMVISSTPTMYMGHMWSDQLVILLWGQVLSISVCGARLVAQLLSDELLPSEDQPDDHPDHQPDVHWQCEETERLHKRMGATATGVL